MSLCKALTRVSALGDKTFSSEGIIIDFKLSFPDKFRKFMISSPMSVIWLDTQIYCFF